jgi:hypothetical protein
MAEASHAASLDSAYQSLIQFSVFRLKRYSQGDAALGEDELESVSGFGLSAMISVLSSLAKAILKNCNPLPYHAGTPTIPFFEIC